MLLPQSSVLSIPPSRLCLPGLASDGGGGDLTVNLAGATALYVVTKSGGTASGRRLLQDVEGEAVVYVNKTSVTLEVRAHGPGARAGRPGARIFNEPGATTF
jgi:hypothetical protein